MQRQKRFRKNSRSPSHRLLTRVLLEGNTRCGWAPYLRWFGSTMERESQLITPLGFFLSRIGLSFSLESWLRQIYECSYNLTAKKEESALQKVSAIYPCINTTHLLALYDLPQLNVQYSTQLGPMLYRSSTSSSTYLLLYLLPLFYFIFYLSSNSPSTYLLLFFYTSSTPSSTWILSDLPSIAYSALM